MRNESKTSRPQAASPRPQAFKTSEGFTLIETIVATGILVTALAGIAQLFALGVSRTRESGSHGTALVAAQAKLETLRSRTLAYGPDGETITDPLLDASPASSLEENATGYVEGVDASGQVVDADVDAVFTRRWRITAVDDREPRALVLEVCVFRWPATGAGPPAADACLATIRSRQP